MGGQELLWQHKNNVYSTVAVDISGRKDATVRCQRFSEAWFDADLAAGKVQFIADGITAPVAQVSWQTCRNLNGWEKSDKTNPTSEQIAAVHVLSHEIEHVRGTQNEADTECYAMQRNAAVAQQLGATERQGKILAFRYWSAIYPNMLDDYRSADCAPKGRLDMNPENPDWP